MKDLLCNILTLLYYVRFMLGTDKYAGEQVDISRRGTDKKVTRLMRAAFKVPFYKKKFEQCGLRPDDFQSGEDLTKFPVTTKDELRDWMEHEITPKTLRWRYINGTSGSSGKPLKVIYSISEKAYERANWMRVLSINGFRPLFGSTMAIKAFGKDHLVKNDSILQKIGLFRRSLYSALEDIGFLTDAINKHKPTLLYANKSMLIRLAVYCKKNGIDLHRPKFICATSESLDDKSLQQLTEFFGNVIFQSYGCEELGAFTYADIKNPSELKFLRDGYTFFIKDSSTGRLHMESGTGDIFVTSLFKRAFPIINYQLGDSVEVSSKGGVAYISKVQGRTTDWFYFKDGKQLGFQPFYYVADTCPYCYQMRFIQNTVDTITVQAVKNDECTDIAVAEQWITNKLKAYTKEEMTIHYEWMDEIPAEKNGKVKFMISEVVKEC